MIRLLLYVIILSALFFAPLQRIEIANLEPIQGIWAYVENNHVVLETDTEDEGVGDTVEEALENMKQNSAGIIYLDTAQYLFVSETAQDQISALHPFVKGTVKVCQWGGEGSINEAVKYADSHKIGLKMKLWKEGSKLPELPPIKQQK